MAAHQASHPWDSPGKKNGVGCHFLLQCMKVKSESEVAQLFPTLCDPMDCSLPGSSIHGFSRQEYWSGVPLPSPQYYLQSFNLLHLSLPRRFSRFYLLYAGLFSVWFPPWHKGAVVDTFLGSLVLISTSYWSLNLPQEILFLWKFGEEWII